MMDLDFIEGLHKKLGLEFKTKTSAKPISKLELEQLCDLALKALDQDS